MKVSASFLVVGLVSIVAMAVAAALFVTGDKALERLAFVAGIIGLIVPSLAAALKADQSQQQTNGNLDARIEAAVGRVVGSRRRGDRVTLHETPSTLATELVSPMEAEAAVVEPPALARSR